MKVLVNEHGNFSIDVKPINEIQQRKPALTLMHLAQTIKNK